MTLHERKAIGNSVSTRQVRATLLLLFIRARPVRIAQNNKTARGYRKQRA